MVTLQFIDRQAARLLLKAKITDLYGNAFETFFQNLMCLRNPDFADIRTAGRLGDIGSDGLLLHGRKLYACYAPEVFDAKRLQIKFADDLEKAKTKRSGQFDIFVFVHNDIRGLHPALSVVLATAVIEHKPLRFEPFGYRHFHRETMCLERHEVEDLLGTSLPLQEIAYGVALEALAPLLDHLRERRVALTLPGSIEPVSGRKLNFNRFSEDVKEELQRMWVLTVDIDRYYAHRIDVTERDEVANGFREEYLRIREELEDPDDVLWQLEQYVLGNLSAPLAQRRAAMAILAYFFQTCDIFENPPKNWVDPAENKEPA